ncbi:hypothetical protein ZWY2020_001318 [Hordeum vulgare]|nr:hypothetical protein ZWY2020_001318 [Hordeum vulgare]
MAVCEATESVDASTEGDSGIGAENNDLTTVVPKKLGIGGARARGDRLRRATSDAGMDPELAAHEVEADMVATTAALGLGCSDGGDSLYISESSCSSVSVSVSAGLSGIASELTYRGGAASPSTGVAGATGEYLQAKSSSSKPLVWLPRAACYAAAEHSPLLALVSMLFAIVIFASAP